MAGSISRRNFLATSAAGIGLAATGASNLTTAAVQDAGILPVRPLGMTGLLPALVGFGSGSRYMSIEEEATAERMIHRAIELGVRYFDTAHSYTARGLERGSHKRLGRYLVPHYRKQVIIATKVQPRDAETAKRQVDDCFADLGTDVIDILALHAIGNTADVDQLMAQDGALRVLRDLKDAGAIRCIGITGHADSKALVDAMERIQPDTIMSPQNPGHSGGSGGDGTSFTKDILPYALKHGIGLLAMKTTAQDGLTGAAGISAPDLVRYAMSLPVASAIIGMNSLEVLESCTQIARTLQPMTADEMAAMRSRLLASMDVRKAIPYLAPGYIDGFCQA
jgi:uncharacterized protein